jgi:hypothetical protein
MTFMCPGRGRMGGRHRAVAGDGRVQTRLLHGLEAQAVLHEHHLCVLQTRRDVEPLRPSLRAHEEKTRHDARDPPPALISTLLAPPRAFSGYTGGRSSGHSTPAHAAHEEPLWTTHVSPLRNGSMCPLVSTVAGERVG